MADRGPRDAFDPNGDFAPEHRASHVVALGFVSLFMDMSSEITESLLSAFLKL